MIKVTCTNCHEITDVPDEFLGQQVRCPKCKQFSEAVPVRAGAMSKRQKMLITFALPLVIEVAFTFVHLLHERHSSLIDPLIYNLVCFGTLAYTALLFAAGVLSASSSTMESLNARIKKEEDTELQWFRQYLKMIRRWLPAYNTSFRGPQRMIIGGVISSVYILALILNGFVGAALVTLISLLMIWLGMRIVRDCQEMAAEERARKAKKKAAAENAGMAVRG
ncbi:MAG TPA: hypothetical protein VG326_03070 [Tepidisphaeraceae bacterium]|jgi:predicted PurR-regulated permease PerM|nr:hypothetical protein [Tepidisphaeraceae bacterium]